MGVAAGDYDNDGFVDLYVTGYGATISITTTATATFADVTKKLGVGGSGWSTSAGWLTTIATATRSLRGPLSRLGFRRKARPLRRQPGTRAYCHPENFRERRIFSITEADGSFEETSVEGGIAEVGTAGCRLHWQGSRRSLR